MKKLFGLTILFLAANIANADTTGSVSLPSESWQGYQPSEAVKDMLSSPLKLVGKARSKALMGVESCVFRNDKVTVVRSYCNISADAERGDSEQLKIIPHDNRGSISIYAEPSSGIITKNGMWHVNVMDVGREPPSKPFSKQSAKEIIAYTDSIEYGDAGGRACYVGSPTVITYDSNGKSLAPKMDLDCYDLEGKKFKTNWVNGLSHFFDESNRGNWIKMLGAVGVKKALPKATSVAPSTDSSEQNESENTSASSGSAE